MDELEKLRGIFPSPARLPVQIRPSSSCGFPQKGGPKGRLGVCKSEVCTAVPATAHRPGRANKKMAGDSAKITGQRDMSLYQSHNNPICILARNLLKRKAARPLRDGKEGQNLEELAKRNHAKAAMLDGLARKARYYKRETTEGGAQYEQHY